MNKNIVIIILILIIAGSLVFILANQYNGQKQQVQTVKVVTPIKPAIKKLPAGEASVISIQQDIQKIDIGSSDADFKQIDADISTL